MKTRLLFTTMLVGAATLIFLRIVSNFPIAYGENSSDEDGSNEADLKTNEKLLIIMLDGFRWDYYDMYKSSLHAFHHFISEGVQAEWVEPVFPSSSFPSWTTISTGVFPETHGIIGNYMFDSNETNPSQAVFSLSDPNSTRLSKWWQNSEPIWTTATKNGKKSFLRWWSRCEVPFHGVSPQECTGYESAPGVENVRTTFKVAVEKLKDDFDLVMVYGEHTDNTGHAFGPNSPEIKQALVGIDDALHTLLRDLLEAELDDKVNIIIVSDHGMTWAGFDSGVEYLYLDDYISPDEIYKVVDSGPVLSIATLPDNYEDVYEKLKKMKGVDVYKREDIPDELHFKHAPMVNDILVVAKNKYLVRELNATLKQIPLSLVQKGYYGGLHGYADMEDMRTIFFAKGPAFKKGFVSGPIHLEDEYQLFAKLLKIPPQPHNGSWNRISEMLVSVDIQSASSISGPELSTIIITILHTFTLSVGIMFNY